MNAAHILPPPPVLVEPIVRAALVEDLGLAGDITTDAVIPAAARLSGAIVARQAGVLAGLDAALLAFRLLDPMIKVVIERPDGSRVARGEVAVRLDGPARPILTAERVALNLFCRLSGIATATAALVEAARPHGPARIVCTRKTTPGLRALEKYAVRAGGGSNHRFGLDDAVLIKDNHVSIAGGITPAIKSMASTAPAVPVQIAANNRSKPGRAVPPPERPRSSSMTTTFSQPRVRARVARAYCRRRLSGLLMSWSGVDCRT